MLPVGVMPSVAPRPERQPVINAIEAVLSMPDRLLGRDRRHASVRPDVTFYKSGGWTHVRASVGVAFG